MIPALGEETRSPWVSIGITPVLAAVAAFFCFFTGSGDTGTAVRAVAGKTDAGGGRAQRPPLPDRGELGQPATARFDILLGRVTTTGGTASITLTGTHSAGDMSRPVDRTLGPIVEDGRRKTREPARQARQGGERGGEQTRRTGQRSGEGLSYPPPKRGDGSRQPGYGRHPGGRFPSSGPQQQPGRGGRNRPAWSRQPDFVVRPGGFGHPRRASPRRPGPWEAPEVSAGAGLVIALVAVFTGGPGNPRPWNSSTSSPPRISTAPRTISAGKIARTEKNPKNSDPPAATRSGKILPTSESECSEAPKNAEFIRYSARGTEVRSPVTATATGELACARPPGTGPGRYHDQRAVSGSRSSGTASGMSVACLRAACSSRLRTGATRHRRVPSHLPEWGIRVDPERGRAFGTVVAVLPGRPRCRRIPTFATSDGRAATGEPTLLPRQRFRRAPAAASTGRIHRRPQGQGTGGAP